MEIHQALQALRDEGKAAILRSFFKTGKGEYGEGDIFLGISVPSQRKVAKEYKDLDLKQIKKLLESSIHEYRLVGLLILVNRYEKTKDKAIIDFYLANLSRVNNWDLVDQTADKILGDFLFDKDRTILERLARSENLWERRIAIISTFSFIKKGDAEWTFRISEMLLEDRHDLIHKAVGWMLREVGKRIGEKTEELFLQKHYKVMPRTMLRYAIERFPKEKKEFYMKK